jgi:uncharacterized membrane protein SpoIIM required for sporulation
MNIQRWIGRREANWRRLGVILGKIDIKGLKSLNYLEIRELASLYRSVSADLARAKTHNLGEILQQDLQRLTSRSYSQIYQGFRRQEWQGVREFYQWGFPATVQRNWAYIALALLIFLVGALVAWWYAWQDPQFIALIVPMELIDQVRNEQKLWMGSILGVEPLASTNIMINNLSVSFKVLAGGLTAGIFTVIILGTNGVLLGAIAALVGQNNLAGPFWAFVFPHGSLELPAIFLAGGAGLLLARALLFPGPYRRGDALKFYGVQAAQLIFGVVPMLVIAGIIEGFFSPSPWIPNPIKYIVGMILLTGLIIYFSRRQKC